MKKHGSICDYKFARNENLKREFYARLGKGNYRRIDDIFPDMLNAPADRFYVSENRALELLRMKWRHGCWPADMLQNRRQMMTEIERRVLERRRRLPEEAIADTIFAVVNSPAPSFYLTARSMRTLVYACVR